MADKKSRSYLLSLLNEKEWTKFKKTYKEKGLGSNLDESIFALIKKENNKTSSTYIFNKRIRKMGWK